MTYPENDTEFQDETIDSVEKQSDGTYAIGCDGWHLWCGKDCPIVPKVGWVARKYGRGIGAPVRGLFIDGVKVWYRTDAEEREHREIESYGADAADWLARWDAGQVVWSIEMGGLGPGYEQCIQITAAEILRHMLAKKYDHSKWSDKDAWDHDREALRAASFKNKIINDMGLSGAQYGAATNLACRFYMDGPRKVMNTPEIQDRKIQVSRTFPGMAP
jgi:hypothetical protein